MCFPHTRSFNQVMAIDQANKAFRAARSLQGRAELDVEITVDLDAGVHAVSALISGVVFTVPWLASCQWPDEPCLLLWMPYGGACGTSQRVTYSVAYAINVVVIIGSLVVVAVYARHGSVTRARIEAADASGAELTETTQAVELDAREDDVQGACSTLDPFKTCGRSGFKMRVRILCAVFGFTSIFHSILAATFVGGCDLSVPQALVLLILVFFVDGQVHRSPAPHALRHEHFVALRSQGIISFGLFGLQPEFIRAATDWLQLQRRRLDERGTWRTLCCLPAKSWSEASAKQANLAATNTASVRYA